MLPKVFHCFCLWPETSCPPISVESQILKSRSEPKLRLASGGLCPCSPSPGLCPRGWVPESHPTLHPPWSHLWALSSGLDDLIYLFFKKKNKIIFWSWGLHGDGRVLDSWDFASSDCFAAAFYTQISHFHSCKVPRGQLWSAQGTSVSTSPPRSLHCTLVR